MTTQLEYQQILNKKLYLLNKQEHKCNYCKMQFLEHNLTIDHMLPRSEKGSNNIENLQLLCFGCHRGKNIHENILRGMPIFAFNVKRKSKKYGKMKNSDEVIGRKIRRIMKRRYRKMMKK